jgi:hypothetical protein
MKNNQNGCGNGIIFSYIGMGMAYEQGKLMYITGKEDAALGDVGTLRLPVQAQGVNIDAHSDNDPTLFSYVRVKADKKSLRVLLAKRDAPSGATRFSVLIPSADCCCDNGGEWLTWTADITFVDSDKNVAAFNPHALAQWGNYLYLVDYETTKIIIVDTEALETAADGAPITVKSVDLTDDLVPSPQQESRGQAVIIMGDYLYALFLDSDASGTRYGPVSYLLRLTLDHSGENPPKYDTQTNVGVNGVSIIPVNDGKAVQLLVPAIGGQQYYDGGTNGTASNIAYVEATAQTWPTQALVKVTGDTYPVPHPDPLPTPTAYDIHGVAAAMRDGTSALFILTQIYTTTPESEVSPDGALWRIYRTTVEDFLGIKDGSSLSDAVTAGALTVVDEGSVAAGILADILAYGIFLWDILYEQVPGTDDAGDRVWVAFGTPILATRAGDGQYGDPGYGSPTALFKNPYAEFGFIGGYNVNMGAFDLTIEAVNQAKRGVSLKRNFRRALAVPKPTEEEVAAAQAKAAQAKAAKAKAGK